MSLQDDNAEALHALLIYLYTSNYSSNVDDSNASPTFDVRVFAVAEKYLVKPLMKIAARKFMDASHAKWDEGGFVDAMTVWRDSISDPGNVIGSCIVWLIHLHRDQLFKDHKNKSEFRRLLDRTPWLAAKVAHEFFKTIKDYESMKTYKCPQSYCVATFQASMREGKTSTYDCASCRGVFSKSVLEWSKHVRDSPTVL